MSKDYFAFRIEWGKVKVHGGDITVTTDLLLNTITFPNEYYAILLVKIGAILLSFATHLNFILAVAPSNLNELLR